MARNTFFEDEKVNKKIDFKQFKKIMGYTLPFKKIFILVAIMMLVGAAVAMLTPLLLRRIINSTAYSKDIKEFAFIISGMIVLAAIEILITYLHQTLMGKSGHGIISSIRKDIFSNLQQLSFNYFDSRPNGKIVIRVTQYVNDLAEFFTNYLLQFLIYIVKIITVFIFMMFISVRLTAVVFGTLFMMFIIVFFIRSKVKPMFQKLRLKDSNRSAFLVESIMGEKIIKNSNRSNLNTDLYMKIHGKSLSQWKRIFCTNELNSPIVEIFWNAGTLAIFGVALSSILAGNSNMNAGIVVAFISYMSLFATPIQQITMLIQQFSQVTSNLEQVFDTIDFPVAIKDKENAVELKNVQGDVEFNDVTFEYEKGNTILEHINIHAKPGQTFALVGPTGAGKTTVISMLTRFYEIKSGEIKVDGTDIRDVTLHSLRKEVGVLMQDPFIFKGSIIENIRYGKLDATDEECIEAAKKIHADKCIMKFKDGYNHVLEERGAGLSAGEKQMIGFARIVLKNPAVLILDEATSSIDTETEEMIKNALSVITSGKTCFIVAHRLSTIRKADKILFIKDKKIAEEGTHEELMKLCGLYYHLNVVE